MQFIGQDQWPIHVADQYAIDLPHGLPIDPPFAQPCAIAHGAPMGAAIGASKHHWTMQFNGRINSQINGH